MQIDVILLQLSWRAAQCKCIRVFTIPAATFENSNGLLYVFMRLSSWMQFTTLDSTCDAFQGNFFLPLIIQQDERCFINKIYYAFKTKFRVFLIHLLIVFIFNLRSPEQALCFKCNLVSRKPTNHWLFDRHCGQQLCHQQCNFRFGVALDAARAIQHFSYCPIKEQKRRA